MLTQSAGFRHRPVQRDGERLGHAEQAMLRLAEDSGEFQVDCSQDARRDVTRANLQKYDVVMFYTTGDLPIAPEDLDYLVGEWICAARHGFLGVHSATDTFKDYRPYWDMLGGTFNGHPWGQNTPVTIAVHNPLHPAAAPFGTSFELREEIYQFRNWQPRKVHVLMSLDMERTRLKRPYHVPVAWAKEHGAGKVFYTSLGHREDTWENPQFLASLIGAIRWMAGKQEALVPPNPGLSAEQWRLAEEAARAAGVDVEKVMRQEAERDAQRVAREAARHVNARARAPATPPASE